MTAVIKTKFNNDNRRFKVTDDLKTFEGLQRQVCSLYGLEGPICIKQKIDGLGLVDIRTNDEWACALSQLKPNDNGKCVCILIITISSNNNNNSELATAMRECRLNEAALQRVIEARQQAAPPQQCRLNEEAVQRIIQSRQATQQQQPQPAMQCRLNDAAVARIIKSKGDKDAKDAKDKRAALKTLRQNTKALLETRQQELQNITAVIEAATAAADAAADAAAPNIVGDVRALKAEKAECQARIKQTRASLGAIKEALQAINNNNKNNNNTDNSSSSESQGSASETESLQTRDASSLQMPMPPSSPSLTTSTTTTSTSVSPFVDGTDVVLKSAVTGKSLRTNRTGEVNALGARGVLARVTVAVRPCDGAVQLRNTHSGRCYRISAQGQLTGDADVADAAAWFRVVLVETKNEEEEEGMKMKMKMEEGESSQVISLQSLTAPALAIVVQADGTAKAVAPGQLVLRKEALFTVISLAKDSAKRQRKPARTDDATATTTTKADAAAKPQQQQQQQKAVETEEESEDDDARQKPLGMRMLQSAAKTPAACQQEIPLQTFPPSYAASVPPQQKQQQKQQQQQQQQQQQKQQQQPGGHPFDGLGSDDSHVVLKSCACQSSLRVMPDGSINGLGAQGPLARFFVETWAETPGVVTARFRNLSQPTAYLRINEKHELDRGLAADPLTWFHVVVHEPTATCTKTTISLRSAALEPSLFVCIGADGKPSTCGSDEGAQARFELVRCASKRVCL